MKRGAKKAAVLIIAFCLVSSGLIVSGLVIQRTWFPPEREVWFNNLLTLAQKADAEYDTLSVEWSKVGPQTWPELYTLVREIIYQIDEEGATTQLILPAGVAFGEYGRGRRSGVAGTYSMVDGVVVLNGRFLDPSWGRSSWLGVLIHELVHAQGYIVGSSFTLESQTEIVATEVLAAMANLDYPGARAELLDGLRRDALAMAYYIARFGGSPIHTTYADDALSFVAISDPIMLARLDAARKAIFTPTELARSDKRIRWWEERSDEYMTVLGKYAVTTLTVELDAVCGSGVVAEAFQQKEFLDPTPHLTWDRAGGVWKMVPGAMWGSPITLSPLKMDDFAYILHSLGYC